MAGSGAEPQRGRGQSPSRSRAAPLQSARQSLARSAAPTRGADTGKKGRPRPVSLSHFQGQNNSAPRNARKPADTGNRERAARTSFRPVTAKSRSCECRRARRHTAVLFELTALPSTVKVRKSLVRGAHELSCECGSEGFVAARNYFVLDNEEGRPHLVSLF